MLIRTGRCVPDDLVNRKSYIGIVDAVLCGEGNGPKIPDPKKLGYIIQGSNPAAIDSVCAGVMGFDYKKIPSIINSFSIRHYKITNFSVKDIDVRIEDSEFKLENIPRIVYYSFVSNKGWIGNIER
ncbi:MAG: DUF362 domain-containing protein [Bacteroidales bacterium]|nr:DUF362 domain-containing protein [Bacteroidales bacterium]